MLDSGGSWLVARESRLDMAGGEPFAYDLVEDADEQHKTFVGDFPEEVRMLRKYLKKLMLK